MPFKDNDIYHSFLQQLSKDIESTKVEVNATINVKPLTAMHRLKYKNTKRKGTDISIILQVGPSHAAVVSKSNLIAFQRA